MEMLWVSIAFALLLLLALLFPFIEPRLSDGRRARRAHRGDTLHWYPNFDEDLRFEPRHEDDVVPISRKDLESFGYTVAGEVHLVPRTFRYRVVGDKKLRLWTSSDTDLRPIWVCAWSGVQLPGAGNGHTAVPLSSDVLARIHSGPSPVLDDQAHVPEASSAPFDSWPSHEEEKADTELHHDVRRFACTEGTPLTIALKAELPPAQDTMDASDDRHDDLALVGAPSKDSSRKRNRKKRGRRGKRH